MLGANVKEMNTLIHYSYQIFEHSIINIGIKIQYLTHYRPNI